MAVKMRGKSTGVTTVELLHEESGAVVRTTAPKDNGGDGSSFSPTDLFAVSLAACASTIVKMYAHNNGITLASIDFEVEKRMAQGPRRVGEIVVKYSLTTDCSDEDFAKLKAAARTCPVRMSLSEGLVVEETFERRGYCR